MVGDTIGSKLVELGHSVMMGSRTKHAGHHSADFWKRFIICSIVTIPVLALSHMIQSWLWFELSFPDDKYVLAIFSAFIFIYGGYTLVV